MTGRVFLSIVGAVCVALFSVLELRMDTSALMIGAIQAVVRLFEMDFVLTM